MRKPSLLFAGFLLLSACSDEVSEADLVGVYIASYRGDIATLTLKTDHTYTHAVQIVGGQKLETEATWKASQLAVGSTKFTAVDFTNFRAVPAYEVSVPAFAEHGPGWASEPDRTWLGQLQFCYDADVGYCYVKQASSEMKTSSR